MNEPLKSVQLKLWGFFCSHFFTVEITLFLIILQNSGRWKTSLSVGLAACPYLNASRLKTSLTIYH